MRSAPSDSLGASKPAAMITTSALAATAFAEAEMILCWSMMPTRRRPPTGKSW